MKYDSITKQELINRINARLPQLEAAHYEAIMNIIEAADPATVNTATETIAGLERRMKNLQAARDKVANSGQDMTVPGDSSLAASAKTEEPPAS